MSEKSSSSVQAATCRDPIGTPISMTLTVRVTSYTTASSKSAGTAIASRERCTIEALTNHRSCRRFLSFKKSSKLELTAVSYTHLRAHETPEHLVCRLLLE